MSYQLPIRSFSDAGLPLGEVLAQRASEEPVLLAATLIFFAAVLHAFATPALTLWGDRIQERHITTLRAAGKTGGHDDVSFAGALVHTLGEVEVVFGVWAVALFAALAWFFDRTVAVRYITEGVHYTEPVFVVIIMAIAATRPILNLSENILRRMVAFGGGSIGAWWYVLLTVGPLLGSFITEPAAITIVALLLAKQFYRLRPSRPFAYATLGLLFVNISVGGTLTHFAAPPVLMVAGPWGWNTPYMLIHFGWKAILGILSGTTAVFWIFRKEFPRMEAFKSEKPLHDVEVTSSDQSDAVPAWIKAVHVCFLILTVLNAHEPVLAIAGFLFLLGFMHMTPEHQNKLEIRSALLVGFFLAGLVIHGGLQGWWIAPVLESLDPFAMITSATVLTAFNDNAAITYLATLVPSLSEAHRQAVVAGAITGGGLTLLANAPNPAGAAVLARFFPNRTISPLWLAAGAIGPTILLFLCFWLL